MKKAIHIFLLFFSLVCVGQESNDEHVYTEEENRYNDFMNHTPKQFQTSLNQEFKAKFETMILDNLATLKIVYGFQDRLEISAEEIKQLELSINQLAVCLFLEGTPVLIEKVGGYDGCPEEMIYTKKVAGTEVTVLNFCYTCIGFSKFIDIVNNRTKKLLGITDNTH